MRHRYRFGVLVVGLGLTAGCAAPARAPGVPGANAATPPMQFFPTSWGTLRTPVEGVKEDAPGKDARTAPAAVITAAAVVPPTPPTPPLPPPQVVLIREVPLPPDPTGDDVPVWKAAAPRP